MVTNILAKLQIVTNLTTALQIQQSDKKKPIRWMQFCSVQWQDLKNTLLKNRSTAEKMSVNKSHTSDHDSVSVNKWHTGDHDSVNVCIVKLSYDGRRLRFEFVFKHNQTDQFQLTFHDVTVQQNTDTHNQTDQLQLTFHPAEHSHFALASQN